MPNQPLSRRRVTLTLTAFVCCPTARIGGSGIAGDTATLEAESEATPAFDVVSIHPCGPQETDGFGASEDEYQATGSIGALIMQAYFPSAFWLQNRLLGAPRWVTTDRYTFIGKVAPEDVKQWRIERRNWGTSTNHNMLQNMLRRALSERCKLIVHRVPGESDGLVLVAGAHGINPRTLVEAKPQDSIPSGALTILGGGRWF